MLGRILEILDTVGAAGTPTRTELSRATRLPQPSLNRIVTALLRHRLLEEQQGGVLTLGLRLFELGTAASQRGIDLVEVARPILLDLYASAAATVQLAVLDGERVHYLVKIEQSSRQPTLETRVAGRWPAHCTGAGKAILAALTPEQLDRLHPRLELTSRTPNTITTLDALMADLRVTRQRGFAIDREEFQIKLTSVAAALTTGVTGHAAVTLSACNVVPERHGPLVRLAARALRAELIRRRSEAE